MFDRPSAPRLLASVLLLGLAMAAHAADAPAEPELWPGNEGPRTRDLTLTPDGDARLFCVMTGGFRHCTILAQHALDDGAWSAPTVPQFSQDPRWRCLEPHVAPAGDVLYYVTDRPAEGETPGDENIWRVSIATGDEGLRWGRPERLGSPIGTAAPEFFPSTTRDGSLYFTRRDTATGAETIMRARPRPGGGWQDPQPLPEAVNAGATRFNAFVDPDERFVIVCVAGHPENLGQVDYWIAFRNDDDTWRGPVNLGDRVNGAGREGWSPYVTPDGEWFTFMTTRAAERPDGPRTYADVLAMHDEPGNGAGHLWRLPAAFLWSLDPGREP